MSKRVTPFRIFLLFAAAIIILLGLIVAFPDGQITEELKFFSWEEVEHPGPKEYVNISELIAQNEEPTIADTLQAEEPVIRDTVLPDTLIIPPADAVIAPFSISYPKGLDTLLYPFFAALDEVRTAGQLIRILHYGDSQIEGDRITAELRQKFHTNPNFGGCGPGILPIQDILQGRLAVQQTASDNWIKYTPPLSKDDWKPHNEYGILSHYYRYIPYPEPDTTASDTLLADLKVTVDSLQKDTLSVVPDTTLAWVRYEQSNMGYKSTRLFQQYRLLYNHNETPLPVAVIVNDTDTVIQILPQAQNFIQPTFTFPEQSYHSIGFQFESNQSPDVYGVALDCQTGVAVDNIGLRGSAIANFSNMDRKNLARQIRMLNARLVVLQFGVNVVPHVVDNYNYYERMYYRNLMALKKAAPNVPILVIGVNDMSRKEGLQFESYPNIELIRTAQQNAAFKAGCAFWDLYEAMGGHNAMVSWVNNEPPLAADDYTHFTARGSRIVGKMLYDAIIEEYYAYKQMDMP